ncbi:hypothetical protein LTS18_012943 [Coniosporium uncinatum]|uniref:Uncharacterized protein n=1 Tax=Coniosporium uncinatum TaxID=93489 RepID=A0ACC3D910_9PEZI|nr:hypothetical protein LTS18_012943 [Coniosporium uncinatum]
MQQPGRPGPQAEPSLEMSLREHLLAAQAGQQANTATQASPYQPHASNEHIDPAIAGPGYSMSGGDSGGDDQMSETRKGRRELSTSKRAAQNRAAQRAFRQRKEEYIKSLKDQVKEYETLSENFKAVQAENYQLRDYIINLQQRLLESQVPLPEAPASIDLSRHPHRPVAESTAGPTMSVSDLQDAQLQAAARQATAASERQHSHEEAQYLPGSQPFPAKTDGSGVNVEEIAYAEPDPVLPNDFAFDSRDMEL